MCHPKPLKRSRLSLNEVDHILMPFFQNNNTKNNNDNNSGRAATCTNDTSTDVAHQITDEALNDPRTSTDGSQTGLDQRGEDRRDGGEVGGLGRSASALGRERNSRICWAGAAAAGNETVLDGELTPIPTPPDPHLKPISSVPAGRNPKRIRFTGAIGEFLDSATVWSDFAVMEAERRANQEEGRNNVDGQEQAEAEGERSEQPVAAPPPTVSPAAHDGNEDEDEREKAGDLKEGDDVQSAGGSRGLGQRRGDLVGTMDPQQEHKVSADITDEPLPNSSRRTTSS